MAVTGDVDAKKALSSREEWRSRGRTGGPSLFANDQI